jgi:hypothetical protein
MKITASIVASLLASVAVARPRAMGEGSYTSVMLQNKHSLILPDNERVQILSLKKL